MKVIDLIRSEKPTLSFEVFPPKTWETFNSVSENCRKIAALSPAYMSVTYGASGTNAGYAGNIAGMITKDFGVPVVSHLTCIASDREKIQKQLEEFRALGIENILALRGDMPKETPVTPGCYSHASDLISDIKEFGNFCIGGACYPEGHPESPSSASDILYLKEKVDAGCEFLTTQMFFDNNILYNFLYRLMSAGVNVPVVAGIMPVTNASSIRRICSISGAALPQRFVRIVEKFADKPESLKQAGIAFATEQIIDLYANGVTSVHLYTMDRPDIAAAITANLSDIING